MVDGDKVISLHVRRRAVLLHWCLGKPRLSRKVTAKQVDMDRRAYTSGAFCLRRSRSPVEEALNILARYTTRFHEAVPFILLKEYYFLASNPSDSITPGKATLPGNVSLDIFI